MTLASLALEAQATCQYWKEINVLLVGEENLFLTGVRHGEQCGRDSWKHRPSDFGLTGFEGTSHFPMLQRRKKVGKLERKLIAADVLHHG